MHQNLALESNVTSAFAAAESKVRNSQIQIFSATGDSFQSDPDVENADIVVPLDGSSAHHHLLRTKAATVWQ